MNKLVNIRVKTNSKSSEISEFDKEKEEFVVNVKSPPENNRANLEIIKLFSKKYKKTVKIIKGLKSKRKTLQIS